MTKSNRRRRMNRATRGLLSAIPILGPVLETVIHSATAPNQQGGRRSSRRGRGRRPARSRMGSGGGRSGVNMPAAFAAHSQSRYSVRSSGPSSVIVTGRDLVYSIQPLDGAERAKDSLMMVIPSNPAYWTGTRVAALASAYTNFRPIRFQADYVPQVSVNEPGTVVMGTIWNTTVNAEDLQQTLITSNGGCMTQCYVPATSRVQLGAELPQNLFYMKGDFGPNTNPFFFTALNTTVNVPGYFFIDYEYELKNPIGSSWIYHADQAVPVPDATDHIYGEQVSGVLLNQDGALGPGTTLIWDGEYWQYDSNPVELQDSSYISIFQANDDSQSIVPVDIQINPAELQIAYVPANQFVTPDNSNYYVVYSTQEQTTVGDVRSFAYMDYGSAHTGSAIHQAVYAGNSVIKDGELKITIEAGGTVTHTAVGFAYVAPEYTVDSRPYAIILTQNYTPTAAGNYSLTIGLSKFKPLLKDPYGDTPVYCLVGSRAFGAYFLSTPPYVAVLYGGQDPPYRWDQATHSIIPDFTIPGVTYGTEGVSSGYGYASTALTPTSSSLVTGFRPGYRVRRPVVVGTTLTRFARTAPFRGRR